ncbi:MAG: potassium transporter Kup [Gammaproteobacteria bacterium RIFCSPHIGHO2_12_FULL_36_30]|nr:MAG: potassium transporter Kup [Gammaproteobacteria bacterium RIFCSPHIGHO2_12_FULL_36_30]
MQNVIQKQTLIALSVAALGIIYGDIGTSPLYAMSVTLGDLPINSVDVFGVLSLIFWALILIVSIKYLCIVLRADNKGEGGILALLALLKKKRGYSLNLFFILGIFGAGLMLGDGMLTPAISVMSAVEGLSVISPGLSDWVLPISFVILLALFLFQYLGTAKIGFLFGPMLIVWFSVLAILGFFQILYYPNVLSALNPYFAFRFLQINGFHGYTLLGGVFLVVTGGEALYADLGHFGIKPIQLSWFCVVLPGLLINYFGQGAYLLNHPVAISNPFYMMAPSSFLIPLVVIATLATVIASQAVISATFSLTKQAVLLGLYPRLPIRQTSESMYGQIYVPQMNFILAVGTLILILIFKNSNAIAHAYGIAVNLVMILTTFMIMFVAYEKWRWSQARILFFFILFILIDVAFLGANLQKLFAGGWIPIMFALVIAFIMYTWTKGMEYLKDFYYTKKEDLTKIFADLHSKNMQRVDSTAILITDVYDSAGSSFLRFLKLNHALPKNILIVNYQISNIPYIASNDRYEYSCVDKNICQLTLCYGFMDYISIPKALYVANDKKLLPFNIDFDTVMYMIEAPNIVASRRKKTLWFYWQERLFAFLMRNYSANLNIEFYHLPYSKTIAIGTYCVI